MCRARLRHQYTIGIGASSFGILLDDDGNGVYATSSGVTVISNCTTANDIYELVPNQTVSAARLTHGDDEERPLVLYSATFESDPLLFDCFLRVPAASSNDRVGRSLRREIRRRCVEAKALDTVEVPMEHLMQTLLFPAFAFTLTDDPFLDHEDEPFIVSDSDEF